MMVTPLTESSKPEMPMPDAAAVPAKPMKWPELVTIEKKMMIYQGGRSCTGARVAPAEKFGLGQKF